MARKKTKIRGLAVWLFLLFVVLIIGGIYTSHNSQTFIKQNTPFEGVLAYQPSVKNTLSKYNLQEYTTVMLALMQQESKGKGGDPMQASESAGLAPGSIDNPKKSIRQGVKHFQYVLNHGKQKNVDFPTIIQSYNMGAGYIDFVAKHGNKHSEKLAKKYSLKQVHKDPETYRCTGLKNSFRKPYCYGDYTYSTKVTQYVDSLQKTAGNNDKKTAKRK